MACAVPNTLSVVCVSTNETVVLHDVLVGDVFFFSGQSNMEFTVNAAFNATAEIAAANGYPLIRVTSGPLQGKLNLNTIPDGPQAELLAVDLPWSVASNVTIGGVGDSGGWDYFSAAAWFTLRSTFDLNAVSSLEVVPLGGIVQCYGGTSIQWWSSPAALGTCAPAPPGSSCCNFGGNNSCLFNAQIAPYTLGPMAFSGVLWYQGEQNAGCGGVAQTAYYECALPALIADWRARFAAPALPFGVFLLAAWSATTPYFPLLRLVQVNVSLCDANVFTASTLDQGVGSGAVHSPFKQIPGFRAALGLQAQVYARTNVLYRGPRFSGMSVTPTHSGGAVNVTVSFDPVSLNGAPLNLTAPLACPFPAAGTCEAFAVQLVVNGTVCLWVASQPTGPVVASASGNVLVLIVPVPEGAVVSGTRGLFSNWPLVQLYNAANLPAEPWLSSSASCL